MHALDPATLTEGSVSDVARGSRLRTRSCAWSRARAGSSGSGTWWIRVDVLPLPVREVCRRGPVGQVLQGRPSGSGRGEALRGGMLRHGGAREPGAILRDMLGDGALITDHVGAAPDPTSMLADLNRGR